MPGALENLSAWGTACKKGSQRDVRRGAVGVTQQSDIKFLMSSCLTPSFVLASYVTERGQKPYADEFCLWLGLASRLQLGEGFGWWSDITRNGGWRRLPVISFRGMCRAHFLKHQLAPSVGGSDFSWSVVKNLIEFQEAGKTNNDAGVLPVGLWQMIAIGVANLQVGAGEFPEWHLISRLPRSALFKTRGALEKEGRKGKRAYTADGATISWLGNLFYFRRFIPRPFPPKGSG